MLAEDELRLAWHAHREGHVGRRDALLTLAVADAGPDDEVWAERFRRWLIHRRPDHCFAAFPTRRHALADPGVLAVLRRVRRTHPPIRVRHLLLRGEAQRGPYHEEKESVWSLVESILAPSAHERSLSAVSQRRAEPWRPDLPQRAGLLLLSVLLALALAESKDGVRAA
jgi:hypothetical protein